MSSKKEMEELPKFCTIKGDEVDLKDVKPGDRIKILVMGTYIKGTIIDPKKLAE